MRRRWLRGRTRHSIQSGRSRRTSRREFGSEWYIRAGHASAHRTMTPKCPTVFANRWCKLVRHSLSILLSSALHRHHVHCIVSHQFKQNAPHSRDNLVIGPLPRLPQLEFALAPIRLARFPSRVGRQFSNCQRYLRLPAIHSCDSLPDCGAISKPTAAPTPTPIKKPTATFELCSVVIVPP